MIPIKSMHDNESQCIGEQEITCLKRGARASYVGTITEIDATAAPDPCSGEAAVRVSKSTSDSSR